MKNTPTHLFHYTSISNLCLILRNRSIRFQRLDKVNDPEEAITKDFIDAKHFTYVSCWTSEEKNEESIPLWNMYSADMKGVRIRLPINMFRGRRLPESETTGHPVIHTDGAISVKRKKSQYNSYIIGPVEVEYKNDPVNIENCFTVNGSTVDVNLFHLGQSKYNHWNFEKEWRYKIIGMPPEGQWDKEEFKQFFDLPENSYIDVNLDESIFDELIVQLGPKATLAESLIVELLLKEYAKGSKLCDSSVKINK